MTKNRPIRVMFVCTGNICRSPMAEAVFRHLITEEGLADRFDIASSGTDSWHVGELPHRGTRGILKEYQIPLSSDKRAAQLSRSDLDTYDYIIAMDETNVTDIGWRHQQKGTPRLLEFAPSGSPLDVPDPYYTGGFDYVYNLVLSGCRGLLDHIRAKEGL